jgi:hypothetical protein
MYCTFIASNQLTTSIHRPCYCTVCVFVIAFGLLAHLAIKPCEVLPSLFVHRPSVNISHFNLLLRHHWANCNQTMVEWFLSGPFQNCVRWSRLPTKMAAKLKIDEKEDETLRNIPVWNYWANLNPTLWNDPWVVPFQICVRHFRPPTKMAATAERNLT